MLAATRSALASALDLTSDCTRRWRLMARGTSSTMMTVTRM
jgi:hypothetical protein